MSSPDILNNIAMFVELTAGHVNFLVPVMNAHSKVIESATSHLRAK